MEPKTRENLFNVFTSRGFRVTFDDEAEKVTLEKHDFKQEFSFKLILSITDLPKFKAD